MRATYFSAIFNMCKQLFFDIEALFKISLHTMKCRFTFLFFIIVLFATKAVAQSPCTALGQNPNSAIPVCGTLVFHQDQVTNCVGADVAHVGCNEPVTSSSSDWYKFTCYQTGTLGFLISGVNCSDDYDWELFDITGTTPNRVYTNASLQVSLNIYGTLGCGGGSVPPNSPTGCSPSGSGDVHCGGDASGNSPLNSMPQIIAGHNYLLMVTNWTQSTAGYDIIFTGGTASITDPLEPHLKSASAPCDGTEIRIKLNKKMKCLSNAIDGSDFTVTDPGGNILYPISTIADACAADFDFDSLSIFMTAPLASGTYTLKTRKGTDANTLKDNCDREIPVDEAVQFTVFPLFPTPMDSLTKPICAPDSLVLVFKKNIKCSSIEPSGSDFTITGPYPVTIVGATANCVRGGSNKIVLKLSAPMQVAGNFFVNLKVGTDGNTIIDECDKETPLPDNVAFVVKDTVNADFNFTINYTCKINTVNYFHNAANGVNSWNWSFTGTNPTASTFQNPVISYINFEPKDIQLIVSNGVCSDTSKQQIVFDNYLKANFDVSPVICPNNPAIFTNKTIGTIVDWQWTMGNGNIITIKNPAPQVYIPLPTADYDALPELIIKNTYGCADTIRKPIKIVYTCFIAVPSAFTPNGDGKNDFLYPLKAYKSSSLSFSVFNRFGQRLFYSNDWQQKWDGKHKGLPQPPGTYVWVLEYTNIETGKRIFEKGTTILIR
jgi:gliding motility-associated-like protein